MGWHKRMNKRIGFDNHISKAPSFIREKNVPVKWRHMDEKRVTDLIHYNKEMPTLVLGHTHEPRLNAIADDGSTVTKYVNTGSSGLYEQLVWMVEFVDGVASMKAWHLDKDGKIVTRNMIPTKDGRLVPEYEIE
mgnify:FL=1